MSFMFRWSRKSGFRREQIRKERPDTVSRRWERLRDDGVLVSLQIAVGFFLLASGILMLREDVVPYRPGQYAHHDIVSRVDFTYMDQQKLASAQQKARDDAPHVFSEVADAWKPLEEKLLALPDRVGAAESVEALPPELRKLLDLGSFTTLKQARVDRANYNKLVKAYIASLRRFDPAKPETALAILTDEARQNEVDTNSEIQLRTLDANGVPVTASLKADLTYTPRMTAELEKRIERLAGAFELVLQPKIIDLTLKSLRPTFAYDEGATVEAKNYAGNQVQRSQGQVAYQKNRPLVRQGNEITDAHWQLLRKEHEAFVQTLDKHGLASRLGLVGFVAIITVVLSAYVWRYQQKIVRKHARAAAIVGLLISMLFVAQLAGISSSPLFFFAVAPTILVAMILAIAYDQRFAMGVATLHAVLVTVALGQGLGFFVILFAGVMTCCHLLDDIRTRSKLIEVGGATALAMMAATAAAGLVNMDPLPFIGKNCLYTGAAGIAVGFVVLGILPFIERAFRITTSMTLLELADASTPLLRRLSVEAPGTYNHSLQVATIAEACAEAIGVNSLLCRVAAYYHDVGKINKPDYFCENQGGGVNRHMNLSPSVSLLIIIGHVKDGIELAREYNLPTSIFPFIQQHHGTTLVEFFYYQACTKKDRTDADGPAVSEVQYRYPGPKPRTKEIAIVMIADAVESATRAMQDPSASRIEALVHDIVMKRLLDGQFDDCDLNMRELAQVERTCVKSLLSIYHGRIAYPSSAQLQQSSAAATHTGAHAAAPVAAKTA
ncbi:MAG TPA: HDIG domain-containing protein [Tepidisphaeraceae bacterium]|nr:HDIG domain-containing protein [Tepidisphaeraceae bacterium]